MAPFSLLDTIIQQRTGVGKFVVLSPDDSKPDSSPGPGRKKQKTVLRSTLSDFSAW